MKKEILSGKLLSKKILFGEILSNKCYPGFGNIPTRQGDCFRSDFVRGKGWRYSDKTSLMKSSTDTRRRSGHHIFTGRVRPQAVDTRPLVGDGMTTVVRQSYRSRRAVVVRRVPVSHSFRASLLPVRPSGSVYLSACHPANK